MRSLPWPGLSKKACRHLTGSNKLYDKDWATGSSSVMCYVMLTGTTVVLMTLWPMSSQEMTSNVPAHTHSMLIEDLGHAAQAMTCCEIVLELRIGATEPAAETSCSDQSAA